MLTYAGQRRNACPLRRLCRWFHPRPSQPPLHPPSLPPSLPPPSLLPASSHSPSLPPSSLPLPLTFHNIVQSEVGLGDMSTSPLAYIFHPTLLSHTHHTHTHVRARTLSLSLSLSLSGDTASYPDGTLGRRRMQARRVLPCCMTSLLPL
jgi:hypothetical protein